jgi:prevent-host-death family protein
MGTVGAFEAKNTLGSLLDRVEAGEEIVITRHGRAVARLVPNAGRNNKDEARAAIDRIRVWANRLAATQTNPEPFDWEAIKKVRDQGRP